MDEHNRKDDLHVEGEGKEAKTRPEEKDVARREFLRKAGQAGLSAGLASFLLIGGKLRTAAADFVPTVSYDQCSPPYWESNPSGNDDACQLLATNPPAFERDDCLPPPNEAGDECVPPHDEDKCEEPKATRDGSDECSSAGLANGDMDVCDGAPIVTDNCSYDDDACLGPFGEEDRNGGDACGTPHENDICITMNQRDEYDFCGTYPGTTETSEDVCGAVYGGGGQWGDACNAFPADPDVCDLTAPPDQDVCDATDPDCCEDPQPDVPGY